jgi:hypothetical protein
LEVDPSNPFGCPNTLTIIRNKLFSPPLLDRRISSLGGWGMCGYFLEQLHTAITNMPSDYVCFRAITWDNSFFMILQCRVFSTCLCALSKAHKLLGHIIFFVRKTNSFLTAWSGRTGKIESMLFLGI